MSNEQSVEQKMAELVAILNPREQAIVNACVAYSNHLFTLMSAAVYPQIAELKVEVKPETTDAVLATSAGVENDLAMNVAATVDIIDKAIADLRKR